MLGFAQAADVTVQSGPARSYLLELFTSEGCSSCPPAENWFSTLRQSPRLWKDLVPVAFHITYWDDLGWTDSLATPAFTNRQRSYAASWGSTSVYTPAFVLNGNEWRARDLDSLPAPGLATGTLSATVHGNGEVQVTFHPSQKSPGQLAGPRCIIGIRRKLRRKSRRKQRTKIDPRFCCARSPGIGDERRKPVSLSASSR